MSIAAAMNVARKYANGGAVDTNPSPAQKEAGNYKMRHITFQGIPITIENPKGTIRSGMDANGKFWSNRMTADYGYIKRTEGKDGDQVDAFVGPNKQSDRVFIIDQLHHHMEKFDEHKCLLGFNTRKQALTAYHGSYGRKYGAHHTVGAVTELSIDAFKEWLKGGGGKEPIAPDVPKFQAGGPVTDTEVEKAEKERERIQAREYTPDEYLASHGIILDESNRDLETEPVYDPDSFAAARMRNLSPAWSLARSYQEGGDVGPPVEDVPGVGPVPTAIPEMPEPIKAAAKAYSETPSWLEQAQQEEARSKEAFQRSGVSGITQQMAADTGPTQELASGFAGTTIGKAGVAPKLATTIGKTTFDLHPDEVASALQTSGTKGTSAGGTFTGFSDGVDRYVKIAKSLDHAKEEVLASKLYELAGVRAAKTELTQLNGKPAVASQIIPYTRQLSEIPPEHYKYVTGLKEDFPAHAWLANWDAPGVGSENPLGNILIDDPTGKAHYVDFGGALRFRGLGGQKGDLFGSKVNETQTLLDPEGKNPIAASVFSGHEISPDNPVAQRIANISNDQIRDLVNIYGPKDDYERASLLAKLVDRRDDLAKQYGITPSIPEKPHIVGGTDYKPWEQAAWEKELENIQHAESMHEPIATDIPSGGESLADYNPNLVKESDYLQMQAEKNKPIKVMNLNKTHSLDQLVNSLKPYHQDDLPAKSITEKQKSKISQLFDKQSISQLAEKMENLDKQEKANLKSWLSPEKKSLLTAKEKISAAPASFDALNTNHSVNQVIGLLKKKSLFDADLTYSQAEKGKKILNNFAPEDIFQAIKDLPLEQEDKIKSWLSLPNKQKISNLQYYAANKAQTKSLFDQFHDYLMKIEPFDFQKYRIPEEITDTEELMRHPQVTEQKRKEFEAAGFNPNVPIFHGGMHDYPEELKPPTAIKSYEPALFAAHRYFNAWSYAGQAHNLVKTFFARAPKTFEINWPELTNQNWYSGTHMDKLIKAAHKHDADLLIIHNMDDMEGNAQTQYAFLKTELLRAPHAKLAKEHLNKAWPLAGVAGGALYTLKDQEPDQYASGGAVKASKEKAHYRVGTNSEHCGICTMFRAPDSCTAVSGKIRWMDNCDYFEKRK